MIYWQGVKTSDYQIIPIAYMETERKNKKSVGISKSEDRNR